MFPNGEVTGDFIFYEEHIIFIVKKKCLNKSELKEKFDRLFCEIWVKCFAHDLRGEFGPMCDNHLEAH